MARPQTTATVGDVATPLLACGHDECRPGRVRDVEARDGRRTALRRVRVGRLLFGLKAQAMPLGHGGDGAHDHGGGRPARSVLPAIDRAHGAADARRELLLPPPASEPQPPDGGRPGHATSFGVVGRQVPCACGCRRAR